MRHRKQHRLQWLALLLTLLCVPLQVHLPAAAADASWSLYQDTIYYAINAQGEAVIKNARASIQEADIPAEIDGCPVTEIESYAFKDCSHLTSLTLPDTIRRIGEFAFKDCIRLQNLVIPDTVEQIGWGAVQGTLWLEKQESEFVIAGQGILLFYGGSGGTVAVPEGVRAVGGYAFDSCTALERIILPHSLVSIDAFSFVGCSNLEQVVLSDGLETIGEYAFHWCTALREIQLPDSVRTVDGQAFSYCKSLEQVQLSAAMTQISNAMFRGCISLETVEIPDGVEIIYNYAFQDCTALKKIVLPESVTEIGSCVFDGCTALEKLSILNPQCRIYDADQTITETADIYGMKTSTACVYAQKYSRSFVPLDCKKGDVNGDGKLTTYDAYLVLLAFARKGVGMDPQLSDVEWYAADYNGDDQISTMDAYGILLASAMRSAGYAVADVYASPY